MPNQNDALNAEQRKRIARIVHTDCTLIPGATFYNAAEMAIEATLAQLATPPSPAAASAHTIGEDAANVASCELCKGVGQIGMPGQRCFACDGSGKSKFSALAANVAIGEREAFEVIHEFLGIASTRLYPTPDKPNSDWAKLRAAVDALALLQARAALTAEKVAGQEPVAWFYYEEDEFIRMYDSEEKAVAACEKFGGHWRAVVFAGPQQPAPAQVALTVEDLADEIENMLFDLKNGHDVDSSEYARLIVARLNAAQTAQPVAQKLALTDEQRHSVDFAAALLEVKGYTGRARDLRSILAAQPVSGGKS